MGVIVWSDIWHNVYMCDLGWNVNVTQAISMT
jgi:hypothetical protein